MNEDVSFVQNGDFPATPPKFNIPPEKWWLEDYFPFGARPIFNCELLNFRGVVMLVFQGLP